MQGMNVELLRKVQKHILEDPNRLVMNYFIVKKDSGFAGDRGDKFLGDFHGWDERQLVPYASCGTAGCIAGWTVLLTDTPYTEHNLRRAPGLVPIAAALLDIDAFDARDLFYVENWPANKQIAYNTADNQQKRALIVSEVIDLFIEGSGKFVGEEFERRI